jgi:hypothetical protein
MISKYKERVTVSLLKTNIKILDFESGCNNQTKSEFIDTLITNYANDYMFKRIAEINIIKKLADLGFNCAYVLLNVNIDHDTIIVKTNGYYNGSNDIVSIIAESTFDFKVKILQSIKRTEN